MNNKQNLHTHTTYVDGKDTPEEIILECINRGFTGVGFSEHSYMPYSSLTDRFNGESVQKYKSEIANLKNKYNGIIDVFCGLELDYYSKVDLTGYDYIIGSVHYLDVGGKIVGFDRGLEETLNYVNAYFDGDGLKFSEKYYETLINYSTFNNIDILGHFDILTKNNEKGKFINVSSKQYLDLGFEAIHTLKGKIPLIEINTGAISRGYKKVAYPQIEFLKEFYNCGFGIVITSDCHNKNFIDANFEDAELLAKQAGFKCKWILTNNGFKEVEI